MAIAQVLAGFTLGAADNLRRAMGKKKKEELDKQYAGFQAGMLERGFPQVAIDKLWEILLPFSDYAFNKSHSAAYGVITYWTAYLKANYPTEYMAALLTSVKDDKDKMAIYLNECRRMKIQVLPPDVNESHANFTPVGNDIRFGLTAVRNVGQQRRRRHRGRPRGEGPLRRLQRLHGEGPGAGLQQARRGVADQGRRLRRHEAPAPRAGRGPRDGRRPVRRPQEERGDRPGLPLRRPRRRRRRLRGERDHPRHRRLGQDDAARPRAGDARPLRLRPPAPRPRARAVPGHRLHDRPAAARRGARPRLDAHRQRPDHLGPAQDHQARRPVGDDHARGPRRRDRGAAVPERLHARLDAAGRGRDRADQGPALARQGPARAARAGGHGPRPDPGPDRSGRDQPAVDPLHAAGGGPAARRARHPPRHDRGPAAAADPQLDQGAAARRQPAGDPEPGPVRRPQAAAWARDA